MKNVYIYIKLPIDDDATDVDAKALFTLVANLGFETDPTKAKIARLFANEAGVSLNGITDAVINSKGVK
jgi:hypothetical protein